MAVDDRLSIDTIDNAPGLICKAGFLNSEYYFFNADNQEMQKVRSGKPFPFQDAATLLSVPERYQREGNPGKAK